MSITQPIATLFVGLTETVGLLPFRLTRRVQTIDVLIKTRTADTADRLAALREFEIEA